MMQNVISDEIRAQLIANGHKALEDENFDPIPPVKLFSPDGRGTWLLGWIYPDRPDVAYCLADLGLGYAECGDVYLSDILSTTGGLGLSVERDMYFRPDRPLSAYAEQAMQAGSLQA